MCCHLLVADSRSCIFESRRINSRFYCLTRSVENRRRDVLGSRKLPVERDGRFPTTKICSYTNPPPSTTHTFTPATAPYFLSATTPLSSSSLSAAIYLVLTLETRVRIYEERERVKGMEGGKKLYRELLRGMTQWVRRRCRKKILDIALESAPDYRPSGYGKS